MNDDQLTKLFHYLDQRFTTVDQSFDEMRASFSQLQASVDGIAKLGDDHDAEITSMSSQLTRHEHWIQQLADKLGVELRTQ